MTHKTWSRKYPWHIIILIDQSIFMVGENADKAAECVQNTIFDIVASCIHGECILDCVFITVIGYGRKDQPVNIIRQGWVSEWAEDVLKAKLTGDNIIPAIADCWGTPMTEAFKLAKECLDWWIQEREKESLLMGTSIVLNITCGVPDDELSAIVAAQEILETNTSCGKVLLFNAHMYDENEKLVYPSERTDLRGNSRAEFLFDISSPLTDMMVNILQCFGFETIRHRARGYITNPKVVRFKFFG